MRHLEHPLRVTVVPTLLTAIAIAVAGCVPWAPSGPPMALVREGGEIGLVLCLGEGHMTRLHVSFSEELGEVWTDDDIQVDTVDDLSIPVKSGSVLPINREIPGVEYVKFEQIPLTASPSATYVGVWFVAPGESVAGIVEWTVRTDGLGSLRDGDYLYMDGSVNSEPCGMRFAQ